MALTLKLILIWIYFISINVKLLISNLSIALRNSYSVKPTLSRFYPQVYIFLDFGMMISGFSKKQNFQQNFTLTKITLQ